MTDARYSPCAGRVAGDVVALGGCCPQPALPAGMGLATGRAC